MKILIVDDDPLMQMTFKSVFKGEHLFFATSVAEAEEILKKEYFDAAFLDIQLKEGTAGDGVDLLKLIRERDSYMPCVMISGLDDRETVLQCLKAGAVDYVAKGTVTPEAYLIALYKACAWRKLLSDSFIARHPKSGDRVGDQQDLLGSSPLMKDLRLSIQKMAGLDGPFLILGETGTGKELAARALWTGKNDFNRPFVAINCASLPENLVESELFGFEKGSFTGAATSKTGLFEAANGGDIFLDEIGELSPDLQAKFLRVLQEKKVRRLGSDKERPLNIRIIAATNVDLIEAVGEKEFREDLFYRINVHQLRLPALRDRIQDVVELFEIFMRDSGFSKLKVSDEAKSLMTQFSWPGNVRQLKAFGEYLKSELPKERSVVEGTHVQKWLSFNQIKSHQKEAERLDPLGEVQRALAEKRSLGIVDMVDKIQRGYVEAALTATRQNRSQAAKVLGVSRQRLSNWLSDWGIF